jgi:pimeloyl-ACP methyl ester carboxylesterase
MNTLKKLFKAIRWIAAILIILFSVATFMGRSYGQTVCLVLIAILLVYWPGNLYPKLKRKTSVAIRCLFIFLLIIIKQVVFKPEPKTSIYRSEENRKEMMAIYNDCMKNWPADTKSYYLESQYGKVNVLECGHENNPPLVMFHAASMGAHSWAENLGPIINDYHIYSFDNPGEGNRSELNDALIFPSNPEEVADLYNILLENLGIDSAVVFGASNGGFIAQNLAYYHPDKVSKMALFGPMGLTRLTNGSIAMMTLSTMYPFQIFRDAVANWALGTAPVCHEKYGPWFDAIIKGTIPSIAQPVPMTKEQKNNINIPVLLFLGSEDKIVGNASTANTTAEDYPDIQIEILSSGHLIAIEKSDTVNKLLRLFLN